ncbi:hypothetical protein [Ekhidna sp.]|uniref:hypothetical protein n=1 Tax=Ekhidna sp. TaxID=2608089 RepID=UPI00351446B9
MRLILLSLLIFSTAELLGQSQTVEPYKFPKNGIDLDIDVDFLTTSERFYKVANSNDQYETWKNDTEYAGSFRYRISFVVSEIYYNLLVEKIELPNEEGEAKKAIERNFYTGFDLAENVLEYGRLTNLSFKQWTDFRTFELIESDELLEVEILTNGQLKVTKK